QAGRAVSRRPWPARARAVGGAAPASLVLVGPDHPRLLDHVILDPLEQRATVETGLQAKVVIQRVDPEVVVVHPVAGRRRGSAVPGISEGVLTGHVVLGAFLEATG